MFRLTLFYFLLFSLVSCQEKKTKFSNITKERVTTQSIIGQSFYRVEKSGNNYILLEPCDAKIPKFVIYKDSIFHEWGQEHYSLNIISLENIDNKIIFKTTYKYNGEKPDDSDSAVIFQPLSNEKKIWKINNEIFINSRYINTILHRKQPCEECGNCEDEKANIDTHDKETFKNAPFSILGKWKVDCEDARSLNVQNDKEIFLTVQGNQIAVNTIKLDKSTKDEYFYRLDKKPLDMGSGGNSLPWNTYLNDNEIFKIKIINNKQIEFTWLGFYNNKTKEREITDCEFTINSGENPVILTKCE